jgi:hypothetical protein
MLHRHTMHPPSPCRQCERYFTRNGSHHDVRWKEPARRCFNRTRLPPQQQHSDLPDESEEGVMWYNMENANILDEITREKVGAWQATLCTGQLREGRP